MNKNGIVLSKDDSNFLKGFFCCCVFLHHLYQYTQLFSGTIVGVCLQSLGYLSVSVFFFLSGYGLMVSYQVKGQTYLQTLPANRIFPLYLQNIFLVFIYTLLGVVLGQRFDVIDILQSVLFGKTVVANGWYIQVILLMYLIFYYVLKRNKHIEVSLFVGTIFYVVFCILFNLSTTWYECVFSFWVGTMCVNHSKMLDKLVFCNNIGVLEFLSGISFLLGNTGLLPIPLKIMFKVVSAILFSLLVIKLKGKIAIRCTMLEKFSRISFEIYVSQGVFLLLYHSSLIYISNPYKYAVCVIISTLIFSFVLNIIFSKITVWSNMLYRYMNEKNR